MKKRYLIFFVLVLATLTLLMSGCGNVEKSYEGKNMVTFEVNGGILETNTAIVKTKIQFAYEPNTYLLDPTELPGYKLSRQGYNFTGWYTSAACNPQDKWDFSGDLFFYQRVQCVVVHFPISERGDQSRIYTFEFHKKSPSSNF